MNPIKGLERNKFYSCECQGLESPESYKRIRKGNHQLSSMVSSSSRNPIKGLEREDTRGFKRLFELFQNPIKGLERLIYDS